MSEYILMHGHLVVDGFREFLDGALYIKDGRLKEVYPQSSKVKAEDVRQIDLKGSLVFPGFLSPFHDKGVTLVTGLDDYFCLRDPLNYEGSDKKIFLGNTEARKRDVTVPYDGIFDLFKGMTGLDPFDPGLANLAFEKNDKYIYVSDDIDETIFLLTYRNIDRDRYLLMSHNYSEAFRKLQRAGASLCDLLKISSLNHAVLYEKERECASLIKGKKADLVVMKRDMDILFTVKDGEIVL